ncbi:MAG: hypothetical protein PHX05_04920 [Acidobacteriota bacterium]|nr:hypothetical protein [Acidobacteriota bacterium]
MKRIQSRKYSILPFILFVAVLAQPSCKKNSIDISDLLGTWIFQNNVTEYSMYIDAEWSVRMNADNTYRIDALSSQDLNGYDCRGDSFRLLLHYPVYNTHIVFRFLWEGKMPDEGELVGKIYSTGIPDSGNEIWDYEKGAEIGSFIARRLSD